jgi:hypothetical protein
MIVTSLYIKLLSGEILAEEQVSELRMIRKIMESIDNVLWSVRSEISIIKNEN